jgi:chromosome segregation ATPase
VENNAKIKSTYEAQAAAYRRTIEALERQLGENEQNRQGEFDAIREKYSRLTQEETNALKNTHTNEVDFLFTEIAHLRASLETQHSKLSVKDHENATLKASYERELSANTGEINTLSKKLMQLEEDRLREVRDLTNRREL